MSILTEIKLGLNGYIEAIEFVRKNKLQRLLFISILLYLILVLCSAFIVWHGVEYAIDSILNTSSIKKWTSWIAEFSWILTLTKVIFYISSFTLFLSLYKYIFLAIASPLYAYISERTAEIITEQEFNFNIPQFGKDIVRGILISLKNLLKQLFLTLAFYMLSFIPIIGLLFGLLIILLDCYYYGFSMIDYNCERHKMNIKQSNQFIAEHKGLAIGNGIAMYLSLMIPILGVILIAPLSAIAATINFYKIKNYAIN